MNKITIPKEFMGIPVNEETFDRVLAGAGEKAESPQETKKSKARYSNDIENPEDWILLEGRQHGNYSYPDLHICAHRLGHNAEVERTAKDLGFQVKDTQKENDGTSYIGNVNWEKALRLNLILGNRTLTPRQGLDLMLDLEEGITGKKKIYDAKGNKVDEDRLKIIHNEIWEVRNPWRAEWLDAKFSGIGKTMHISYNHELDSKGNLIARVSEPLEKCLMEDGYADVKSVNSQGLFTKSAKGKASKIYYWYPRDGAGARFSADSDWASLYCGWDPSGRGSGLGVRAVRVKN